MSASRLLTAAAISVFAASSASAGPCSDRLADFGKRVAMEQQSVSEAAAQATPTQVSRANEWRSDPAIQPLPGDQPQTGTPTQRQRALEGRSETASEGRSAFDPASALTPTQWQRANESEAPAIAAKQEALADLDQAQALDAKGDPACAKALEHYEQMRRAR